MGQPRRRGQRRLAHKGAGRGVGQSGVARERAQLLERAARDEGPHRRFRAGAAAATATCSLHDMDFSVPCPFPVSSSSSTAQSIGIDAYIGRMFKSITNLRKEENDEAILQKIRILSCETLFVHMFQYFYQYVK